MYFQTHLMSIELSTILVQLLQSVFSVHSLKIKNLKKVWGKTAQEIRNSLGLPVANFFS